ncbi:unnamed protein product, partial [Ectocarpus sp. 13 AM-2016]
SLQTGREGVCDSNPASFGQGPQRISLGVSRHTFKPTTCNSPSLKIGIHRGVAKPIQKQADQGSEVGPCVYPTFCRHLTKNPQRSCCREKLLSTQRKPALSFPQPAISRFRSGKSALLPPPSVSCRLTSATPC